MFFSPGREESDWVAERTDSNEHQPALLLMLKSYQRMRCFQKREEIPDLVVGFVRRRWTCRVQARTGTQPYWPLCRLHDDAVPRRR